MAWGLDFLSAVEGFGADGNAGGHPGRVKFNGEGVGRRFFSDDLEVIRTGSSAPEITGALEMGESGLAGEVDIGGRSCQVLPWVVGKNGLRDHSPGGGVAIGSAGVGGDRMFWALVSGEGVGGS